MLGQIDLSVMSTGNLMCLIAAFSRTCFFVRQRQYSISGFSNIPRHSTTIRWDRIRQNRMSPLGIAYLMFIQVLASPPKTIRLFARPKPWPSGWRRCKQSSKNNGPQVAWAWEWSQLSCNLPASLVWCLFFRWLFFFDAGKSCLQSFIISCLKDPISWRGQPSICSGFTDIHSDKITVQHVVGVIMLENYGATLVAKTAT